MVCCYLSRCHPRSSNTETLIQNPAFGPSQIRELTGIFVDKAIEVRRPFTLRSESKHKLVT